MQRQRQLPQLPTGAGGGPDATVDDAARLGAEAESILAAADRILDSLRPMDAETYLHQNRQQGGL